MIYKSIGDIVEFSSTKNVNGEAEVLYGININKFFMPSVANIIGVDLKKYKVVKKFQFACNRMHVGRDKRLPISMSTSDYNFIVSPAYDVFTVIDDGVLPEYLMLWFRRAEFDRECWFYTDADVRGGLSLNALKAIEIYIPSIEKQRDLVAQYQSITNKIKVNEQICEKLEATAQALYKHWFVDFEFPNEDGKPYKSSGGVLVYDEELDREIPEGWELKRLREISNLITKGTTPKEMTASRINMFTIPFLKGESISEAHTLNLEKISYILNDIHRTELKRSKIIKNDLLFTIAGTLGKFYLNKSSCSEMNCNQAVSIIRSEFNHFIYWNFLSTGHEEYFKYNIQQAVQANYSLDTINNYKILIPTNFAKYELFSKEFLSIIFNYNEENQKLNELQSLLLSRLAK